MSNTKHRVDENYLMSIFLIRLFTIGGIVVMVWPKRNKIYGGTKPGGPSGKNGVHSPAGEPQVPNAPTAST